MNIPNLNYETVTIREIFKKFNIIDTRINEVILDISIDKCKLEDWHKDETYDEKIIVTGYYIEPMIEPSNNKVELKLIVDPLEEKNHVTVIKTIPDNFVSGIIYDNEGMAHTIT